MLKRPQLAVLILSLGLMVIAFAVVLLERTPNASDLQWTEGQVVFAGAEMVSATKAVRTLRIAGSPHTFQLSPPFDLPPLNELVIEGMHARIGHTTDTGGSFGLNHNIRVYSLRVNDRDVYTLKQYRAASERAKPLWFGLFILSLAALAFSMRFFLQRGHLEQSDGR